MNINIREFVLFIYPLKYRLRGNIFIGRFTLSNPKTPWLGRFYFYMIFVMIMMKNSETTITEFPKRNFSMTPMNISFPTVITC